MSNKFDNEFTNVYNDTAFSLPFRLGVFAVVIVIDLKIKSLKLLGQLRTGR